MSATDLTKGIYRGGDGPEDLYRRIVGGINGTAMPRGDQRLRSNGGVWDLVNYLYSIRPPELRNKSTAPRRPPLAGLEDEE